jgi:hypothetical protein
MKGLRIRTQDGNIFEAKARVGSKLTHLVFSHVFKHRHLYLAPEQVRALCTWAYLRVIELEEAGFLDEGEVAPEKESE